MPFRCLLSTQRPRELHVWETENVFDETSLLHNKCERLVIVFWSTNFPDK